MPNHPITQVVPDWLTDQIICEFEKAGLILPFTKNGKKYYDNPFSFLLSVEAAKKLIVQLQDAIDYMVQETEALKEYENNAKQ